MKHYIPGRVVDRELAEVEGCFVQLVEAPAGDIEKKVLNAARVSHNIHEHSGVNPFSKDSDIGLIRYMRRHKHTSPFEHVSFTFLVKCPIFVARQWFRHRTGKFNEVSGRYVQMNDEFWYPQSDELRTQSKTNHQCSAGLLLEDGQQMPEWVNAGLTMAKMYELYDTLLQKGVSREQARAFLPLSVLTEFYFTMDLHNLLHFLELRMAADAQPEIQIFANAISNIIKPMIPNIWTAFEDFTLDAVTLTGPEIRLLRAMKLSIHLGEISLPTRREEAEFKQKLNYIFSEPKE